MPGMSDPLVDPAELGTYLNDSNINVDRAELMIRLAQNLCESIVSPLPDIASTVVMRVAARGYTSVLSPRQRQMQDAGSPFGGQAGGAVCLEREDEADLRRFTGGGGVFSIDMLPADYVAPVSPYGYGLDGDGFYAGRLYQ